MAARNALLKYLRVNVHSVPLQNPGAGLGGALSRLISSRHLCAEVKGSFLDKSEVMDRVLNCVKNFQKVDPSKAAKEARYDKEAVMKFFRMLIRRRYFSDELPGASPWSTKVHRPLSQSPEISSDEDQMYKSSRKVHTSSSSSSSNTQPIPSTSESCSSTSSCSREHRICPMVFQMK
ncbi:unnamed protein product [Fraxinus pennsylvanica]|uniref:Uncharacterized protein n=1 Tax=Fraxinus pennsylvanica TaxID=56036 RepID=A0AAD1YLE8_9LAMI|nr:unnamed protein product [Fraxinus pennsylvanica]